MGVKRRRVNLVMKSSLMLKLLLLDGDWIIESKYLSDQEFYLAEISHVGNCRKFRILLI